MILKGYILTYLYLGLILLIAYFLNKYMKVGINITRKIVHISISLCFIIMLYYFKTSINIIIVPLTFVVLNILSYKFNLFKGIENKESLGTIYYPISVLIMAIITYYNHDFYGSYGIGLFCMAWGDGLAPLVASKIKSSKIFSDKTITGCLTVILISLVIIVLFNYFFKMNLSLIKIVILSLISGFLELIGTRGTDNLTLPLGLSLTCYLLEVI